MVIDLQNNRRSHLLSFLTLSPNRYGYDNNKFGILLNHRLKDEKPPIDPISHQFRILKMLDIDLPRPCAQGRDLSVVGLKLWPSDEDLRYIDDFLNSQWLSPQQKMVGINISASERWISKSWPLSYIVKLCEGLGLKQMRPVITGTERDLKEVQELINRVKSVKIINACAKTSVNQLACLVKRCSVYISADSSPLHIAASVSVPFVALFGPTDPRRHLAPAKKCIVIKKDLACSPCYKSKCKSKKCMELITPEEVLEAVDRLLK
jgi:ADP-heptose:LPS heptosyltransferase